MKSNELKPKESDIQKTIHDYLEWNGWLVKKIQQSALSEKGIADLYTLKDGRSVWIEVKTPTGKLSKEQQEFEHDVKSHVGEYIVARSLDDVILYFKGEVRG